jgi:hypothetical protein
MFVILGLLAVGSQDDGLQSLFILLPRPFRYIRLKHIPDVMRHISSSGVKF